MNDNRAKHSLAVAKKMIEIGKAQKFSNNQLKELFVLGYLHDIGYEFGNKKSHAKIGGLILKDYGYKYWREVYYHGKSEAKYQSKYLNILNSADMQINSRGEDVGYQKRLEDIASRYGIESDTYKDCSKLAKDLLLDLHKVFTK